MKSTAAWREGYAHYWDHWNVNDCPYGPQDFQQRIAWLEGWLTAHQKELSLQEAKRHERYRTEPCSPVF